MIEAIAALFDRSAWAPHGYCIAWDPAILWMHVFGDSMIALAYLSIPAAIGVFVLRRKDIDRRLKRVLLLFVLFIAACAGTHILGMATLWTPIYGIEGIGKLATALVSVATACIVWQLMPAALAMPSMRRHEAVNAMLNREIDRHGLTIGELQAARSQLEAAVEARTAELADQTHLFEAAVDGSQIGISLQDRDLRYLWARNPRFGGTAEAILGQTDAEVLPPSQAGMVIAAKRAVLAGQGKKILELTIDDGPDRGSHLRLVVTPRHNDDGEVDSVLCVTMDLTERYLFEMRLSAILEENQRLNQRFRLALRDTTITAFEQDANLVYTWVHNAPGFLTQDDWVGRTDADIFAEETASILEAVKTEALTSGGELDFEFTVSRNEMPEGMQESETEAAVYSLQAEPYRDANGQPDRLTGVIVDITELLARERSIRLLMREVTHRSKNLLAVIQSMARQTARHSDDPVMFVDVFSARLQAMSASHDLLVNGLWRQVSLIDLCDAQFAQIVGDERERYRLNGRDIDLAPDFAQNLGMALHELVTNASKYGALSNDGGAVRLDWSVDRNTDRLEIVWREVGGPPVAAPEKDGFGGVLLRSIAEQSLGGSIDIDYKPGGLVCTIEASLKVATAITAPVR